MLIPLQSIEAQLFIKFNIHSCRESWSLDYYASHIVS